MNNNNDIFIEDENLVESTVFEVDERFMRSEEDKNLKNSKEKAVGSRRFKINNDQKNINKIKKENKLDSIVSIYKDLAIAQTQFDSITKEFSVFTSNDKFMYSYADLNQIIKVVTPILIKNNLVFRYEIYTNEETNKEYLKGIINHLISDEKIESKIEIDKNLTTASKMGLIQQRGAAITFLKRYLIVLMLNLAIDNDDDADRAAELESKPTNNKSNNKKSGGANKATAGQVKFLKDLLSKCKVTDEQFLSKNNLQSFDDVPYSLAVEKITALKEHLGF